MSNFTIEDYKNAIKAKYKEQADGEYSNYLSSPTPANLRKLCVKRFQSNNNKEDLNGFESFFDFPFDKDKRNLFGSDELNKLESVKRFLLGKTEKPNDDTIQLAAILVDLRPRPFNEFRKQLDEDEKKLIDELRDSNIPDKEVLSNAFINEIEKVVDSKTDEVEEDENQDSEAIPRGILDISTPANTGGEDVAKSRIKRYLIILPFIALLGFIFYSNVSQKDCMQWTNDHYQKIEKSDEGYCDTYYDARYFDLKKISVCDTTEFFDNNGRAKVWYIRIGNSVECYNQFAPYPENTQRFLKPITQYIIDKYLANRPKCK